MQQDSIETRLAKLNELLTKNLINQQEFSDRRQKILDSIY